jgi:hypothetical protein
MNPFLIRETRLALCRSRKWHSLLRGLDPEAALTVGPIDLTEWDGIDHLSTRLWIDDHKGILPVPTRLQVYVEKVRSTVPSGDPLIEKKLAAIHTMIQEMRLMSKRGLSS